MTFGRVAEALPQAIGCVSWQKLVKSFFFFFFKSYRGFPLRSRLSRFYDDLNMIAMIGTSDRLCWLAETCKILLLLHRTPNSQALTGFAQQ